MTKRELAIRISNEMKLTQLAVKQVIQKTLDYIVESLANGETVELRNFGVFKVRTRKARLGRNPNKPEQEVRIPAKRVPDFKPGRIMKEKVEKPL
ncbi:MAG: integration host factor subunit beta [Candidatus Aureabacteria bacterium]|nr:integration host factor subunit beta [Candidatus Auribacterota bacterium]